jgi:hypothetical protein
LEPIGKDKCDEIQHKIFEELQDELTDIFMIKESVEFYMNDVIANASLRMESQ